MILKIKIKNNNNYNKIINNNNKIINKNKINNNNKNKIRNKLRKNLMIWGIILLVCKGKKSWNNIKNINLRFSNIKKKN